MRLRTGGLWLLALSGLLTGCERATAPQPAVASTAPASAPLQAAAALPPAAGPVPEAGFSPVIRARIHPDLPEMGFTLRAHAAPGGSGTLAVTSIEVRRGATPEPVQRITGLDTQTPWTSAAPGFEVVDLNFDGYGDIRLVESRPAGPQLPYLHWLYDPTTTQFVASTALNDLGSPRPDPAARELITDWRETATRYGTDHHAFVGGRLVPVRREAREYQRPGVYTLKVSRWVNGRWKLEQTRHGRDP